MDNRQRRTVDAFNSVLRYLEERPIRPEPPLLLRMRTKLKATIDRIQELQTRQMSGYRREGSAASTKHMCQTMRKVRMMPLVRIARPLLRFAPGTEAVLRVPHARSDAVTLATHAEQLAKVLARHSKLLESAGYSSTFLKEFRAEAKALAAAARGGEQARQRRAKATADLAREFKSGMETVTVIEGLVMAHQYTDPIAFKLWRQSRRVPKKVGRPRARRSAATAIAS